MAHSTARMTSVLECWSGNPAAYAELLVVAAQISWFHGKFSEALGELREAQNLDPIKSEIQSRVEQHEAYSEEIWASRRAALDAQRQKREAANQGRNMLRTDTL